MNKDCRDKLDRIKEQSYKLFLQRLLDKEERADIKVSSIGRIKYEKYKKEVITYGYGGIK